MSKGAHSLPALLFNLQSSLRHTSIWGPPIHEFAGQGARGCGCGASKPQLEPTEDEFNAALKEATQELQSAVTDINSILEELQYMKEDLLCS